MSNQFQFNIENIKKSSIKSELKMSYQEYVKHLLDKYGAVEYDYFCTPSCKSRNSKISRTKEGLFCHHIDEEKAVLLSTPEIAKFYPFEYQKAERLVYCNILEHLILHIKIAEERKLSYSTVGIGGTGLIISEINKYVKTKQATSWRKNIFNIIDENYSDYIYVLGYFRNFLRQDTVYSNNVLFDDKFLYYDGKDFLQKIYTDLSSVLNNYKNYRGIIKKNYWCTTPLKDIQQPIFSSTN